MGKIRSLSKQLFGRKGAILLIILSWVTLPFFIVGGFIVFLLIIVISFSLLFRKKIKSATLLFLFSPYGTIPIITIILAAISYFSGTAVLKTSGLMGFPFLDRDYRCNWVSSGCVVWGYEGLYQLPNNYTVMGLTKLFGPMKGTYRGIYPSSEEAQSILLGEKASSFVFSREYIERGETLPSSLPSPIRDLITARERDTLRLGIENLCLDAISRETESGKGICKFSIIRNELLVLGNYRTILLIDLRGKRIIARYFSSKEFF